MTFAKFANWNNNKSELNGIIQLLITQPFLKTKLLFDFRIFDFEE